MNNEEKDQNDGIDIIKLLEIIKEKKIILISIILFCLLISTIVAYMLPKSYKSTALVRVKTTNIVSEFLSSNVQPDTYLKLMKSEKAKENIINTIDASNLEKRDLVKASLDKNLEIVNERNTDLIRISVYAKTPEEAQFVGETVLNGLIFSMNDINTLQKENGMNGDLAIQVIDNVSLPDINNPVKPNKKNIILIGLICSVIISMGYSIYIYNKRYGI